MPEVVKWRTGADLRALHSGTTGARNAGRGLGRRASRGRVARWPAGNARHDAGRGVSDLANGSSRWPAPRCAWYRLGWRTPIHCRRPATSATRIACTSVATFAGCRRPSLATAAGEPSARRKHIYAFMILLGRGLRMRGYESFARQFLRHDSSPVGYRFRLSLQTAGADARHSRGNRRCASTRLRRPHDRDLRVLQFLRAASVDERTASGSVLHQRRPTRNALLRSMRMGNLGARRNSWGVALPARWVGSSHLGRP
jgi:hypothetical protein